MDSSRVEEGGGGHDDDEKVDMVPKVFGAVIEIEEDFDLTKELNEHSRSRVRDLLRAGNR